MIGFDKFLHFAVSFLLAQISPGLAYVAGWAKELADLTLGGAVDFGDAIANGLGILAALFIWP